MIIQQYYIFTLSYIFRKNFLGLRIILTSVIKILMTGTCNQFYITLLGMDVVITMLILTNSVIDTCLYNLIILYANIRHVTMRIKRVRKEKAYRGTP